MLTKRENLAETIKGGNPDRYVKQFEYMHLIESDPFAMTDPYPAPGETNVVNGWGVTLSWPEGMPGAFPVHDEAHKLLKDITQWKDILKAPKVSFPETAWESAIKEVEGVDRKEEYVTAFMAPGLFDDLHYFMGMEEAMMNFYEEPECVHEIIKYCMDWEIRLAEQICDHLHPDALFHHDDWGSQISTFISKDMFDEFLLAPYKELYGYYRSKGVELIVHHSDSYAATLVPEMIEMGVDIWQGVMVSNHISELIDKYGGKITFQGGIDSATLDHPGWTQEEIPIEVERACREYGTKYFIPNLTQGGPYSTFDGVYDAVNNEIDKMSKKMF